MQIHRYKYTSLLKNSPMDREKVYPESKKSAIKD